jgi:enoyl-CoA hydratase/carnithine racemase
MSSDSKRRIHVPESLDTLSVGVLEQALVSEFQDTTSEVVVLVGGGETFCRGLDLDGLATAGSSEAIAEATDAYCRCLMELRFSHKPTIAVVRGAATGGGVGLVAACDLVIATDLASFALPEVLFGFGPAMVLPLLLERVSQRTARLWALSAFKRTAQEALAEGLVDRLVSESALEAEVSRWTKVLRRGHPRGIATVKQLCADFPSCDVRTGINRGRQSTLEALQEPGIVRGIARFMSEGILPKEIA